MAQLRLVGHGVRCLRITFHAPPQKKHKTLALARTQSATDPASAHLRLLRRAVRDQVVQLRLVGHGARYFRITLRCLGASLERGDLRGSAVKQRLLLLGLAVPQGLGLGGGSYLKKTVGGRMGGGFGQSGGGSKAVGRQLKIG